MKLDKSSIVWINCKTEQEKEEMLDIFEAIGAAWPSGRAPRQTRSYQAPMHYLLKNGEIRHGDHIVFGEESYVKRAGGVIVRAEDFHNQHISIRRQK